MTDQEYRDFLDAIAKKHLRLAKCMALAEKLEGDIEAMMAVARFLHVVQQRLDKLDSDVGPSVNPSSGYAEMYRILGREIADAPADQIVDTLRKVGMLAALDEEPDLVLSNLTRNVIPPEDIDLLRRGGIEQPEAELTILITLARTSAFDRSVDRMRLGNSAIKVAKPSEAFEQAASNLKRIGTSMGADFNDTKPAKKRKLLNGIGHLLGGFFTAGGNVLLATGTIAAPNPATGYLAIGSGAAATVLVFKGLGDLQGE